MRRLPHLDAVRGIAALVVMAHHAWLALPAPRWQPHTAPLAGAIMLGRPAVILFFVLSGYVLALSWRVAPAEPARFALRRLLRILPPLWAATLVAYLLFLLSPHRMPAGFSPWLNDQWRGGITPLDLLRQAMLLAGPRQFPLDHVAWSLVHELRFSLVIPFIVLLTHRCGGAACIVAAAAASIAADVYVAAHPEVFPRGVHGFLFDAEGLGPSLVLSARFALPFTLGVAAASNVSAITAFASRPLATPIALVASVLLLSSGSELAMTVGAGLLVSFSAASKGVERALGKPAFVWLGRVSYSLYLLHLPIMISCAAWVGDDMPAAATLAVAMATSLLAADLFFRVAERPSIRLSRLAGTWAMNAPRDRTKPLPPPAPDERPTAKPRPLHVAPRRGRSVKFDYVGVHAAIERDPLGQMTFLTSEAGDAPLFVDEAQRLDTLDLAVKKIVGERPRMDNSSSRDRRTSSHRQRSRNSWSAG